MSGWAQKLREALVHPRATLFSVVASVLISLPTLSYGRLLDDHWQQAYLLRHPRFEQAYRAPHELFAFFDGVPERTRYLMNQGLLPWFTDPELRIAFFRPLSALLAYAEHLLFADATWAMHAVSIGWYALASLAACMVMHRVIEVRWVAALAGLFWAIDMNHAPCVGWLANRNALLCTAFALGSLSLQLRATRTGERWAPWASAALLALGLSSGETALGVVGYLAAGALFLDAAPLRERAGRLLPHGLLLLLWAVVYRLSGAGTRWSAAYVDPLSSPLRYLARAAQHLPVLLPAEWGLPAPDLAVLLNGPARLAAVCAYAAGLALVSLAFASLVRSSAQARFFALGALLSCLPVAATMPSARLLLLPGVGLLGLAAMLIGQVLEGVERRRGVRFYAHALLGYHLVLAPVLFEINAPMLGRVEALMRSLDDSLGRDPSIASQRLVVLNAPDAVLFGGLLPRRELASVPAPRSLLTLSAGTRAMRVKVIDERTLEASPEGGFVLTETDRVVRSALHPFKVGERVKLDGVDIEVTSVDAEGLPMVARFAFDVPLSSPSLRVVRWRGERLEPFVPVVGDEVSLEMQWPLR